MAQSPRVQTEHIIGSNEAQRLGVCSLCSKTLRHLWSLFSWHLGPPGAYFGAAAGPGLTKEEKPGNAPVEAQTKGWAPLALGAAVQGQQPLFDFSLDFFEDISTGIQQKPGSL